MDIHVGEEAIDPEVVRQGHLMDKAIEHKYGVKHIHYYINTEERMGFCLISGPDKETCARVHKEAHGNMANNIIEVQETSYELLMGKVRADSSDMIQMVDGNPDPGNRFILFIELIGVSEHHEYSFNKIMDVVGKNRGRLVDSTNSRLTISFTNCNEAIYTTSSLVQLAEAYQKEGAYLKIGLATGAPVTKSGKELFDAAIEQAAVLSKIAKPGLVLVPSKIAACYKGKASLLNSSSFRLISKQQMEFISRLIQSLEDQLTDGESTINDLCHRMGSSRAQLYRSIREVTGKSPMNFSREYRICRAFQMIKKSELNISEIAYELGYNQPTIFSRHFKQFFGITPSSLRLSSQAGDESNQL